MYDILLAVREAGYYPILAHPERYVYMEMRDYERLKGLGIKFQMNLFSQTDRYGKTVRKKMNALLDKHYYNYVGTDLHRISMLDDVDRLKLRSL
jgi:tyrosine-protein phosphatase YwqE